MKVELQAKNLELKGEAGKVASKIDGKTYVVIRQASEGGQLFGSVSTRDIAALLKADGGDIGRGQVLLNAPIKAIGQYKVPLAIHPEVEISITVTVARSQDEAERIARGENVLIARTEEEEQAAAALATAESFFEPGAGEAVKEGEAPQAQAEGEAEKAAEKPARKAKKKSATEAKPED
jgi:large subunit ribosomal protein L9